MKRLSIAFVLMFFSFFILTTSVIAGAVKDQVIAENEMLGDKNAELLFKYAMYKIQAELACDALEAVMNVPIGLSQLLHEIGEANEVFIKYALNAAKSGDMTSSIDISLDAIKINRVFLKDAQEVRELYATGKKEAPYESNYYSAMNIAEIEVDSSGIPEALIKENKKLRETNRILVRRCNFARDSINDLRDYTYKSIRMTLVTLDATINNSEKSIELLSEAINQMKGDKLKESIILIQAVFVINSYAKDLGIEAKKSDLSFQKNIQDMIKSINSII